MVTDSVAVFFTGYESNELCKIITASHYGITIQPNNQLQFFRLIHLCLRLQNPVKHPVRNPETNHFFVVCFDRVLDLTIIE